MNLLLGPENWFLFKLFASICYVNTVCHYLPERRIFLCPTPFVTVSRKINTKSATTTLKKRPTFIITREFLFSSDFFRCRRSGHFRLYNFFLINKYSTREIGRVFFVDRCRTYLRKGVEFCGRKGSFTPVVCTHRLPHFFLLPKHFYAETSSVPLSVRILHILVAHFPLGKFKVHSYTAVFNFYL